MEALKSAVDKHKRSRGPASRTQRRRSPESRTPSTPQEQGDSSKPKPLQVHAGASRADSSPKDLLAIKAGRGSYSSPSVGHTSASKSIGEAIKNAKKTSPPPLTPGSPIIKRGSRGARRSSSQATDFNFSEAQVQALETSYQGMKGSVKKLSKSERKQVAAHTKLTEGQIEQWVEARNRAEAEEMDRLESADFISGSPAALAAMRTRGVVASKLPSKADVEVVDILDEEEEETEELSLEEQGSSRGSARLKMKEDVKLTMVKNQQLPNSVLAKASPAKAMSRRSRPAKYQGEVEEWIVRVEELEAAIKEKDSETSSLKRQVAEKDDLRAQMLDLEHSLTEKDKTLKLAESRLEKLLDDQKKTLAKKVEEELKRKLKEQSDLNVKIETLQKDNIKLKSDVEEIKLIKDDEIKSLKVDNKSLKVELKRTIASKDDEIKALKSEVKSLKTDDKKEYEEAKAKELAAKEETFKAELEARDAEFRKKVELQDTLAKEELERKSKEAEEKMSDMADKFEKLIKKEKDQSEQIVGEYKLQLLSKEEEVVKWKAQSTELEKNKNMQKRFLNEAETLRNRLLESEKRESERLREVLDLKSYQRKLETKITQMEEQMLITKAGAETQGKVKGALVAKLKEKEVEFEKQEKELNAVQAEKKAIEAKFNDAKIEWEAIQTKAGDLESQYVAQIARLQLQLKEAEVDIATFPLSSAPSPIMYAANTPNNKRRHGSHRRLRTCSPDLREKLVQGADVICDQPMGFEESPVPINRPVPFPKKLTPSVKRGRSDEDEGEEEKEGVAAKRTHLDEDVLEDKDVSDLLNTSQEGEDNLDIAEEDITKLLDDTKDISSSLSAVAPLLNEVLDTALASVWQKEEVIPPMSPAFSISTTPRSTPFVRNTPSSLRRHGSHRRLHDSGLAESEGDFEDDEAGGEEDLEVFTSQKEGEVEEAQLKGQGTRPLPFVQKREGHFPSKENSLSSNDDQAITSVGGVPVQHQADDLTYQDILALLRR